MENLFPHVYGSASLSSMAIFHTIGRLAREAGVPTSTVRYYERIGLLHANGRTGGNYRFYSATALERLRFIRAAQASGFTLDDVTALLNLRDGESAPCQEVQSLIEERLSDMAQRLKDLQHVQRVLKSSLKLCREVEDSGYCQVIDDLTEVSSVSA